MNIYLTYPYQSKEDSKDQGWYNQITHLAQDTIWESDKKHKKTSHTRAKNITDIKHK